MQIYNRLFMSNASANNSIWSSHNNIGITTCNPLNTLDVNEI
jgi:hypothetical protein